MTTIVFEKILMMFMILALGVVCLKSGIFNAVVIRQLSIFLLQVINPIVIFVSYQRTFTRDLFDNLLLSFSLSVVAFLLQIAIAYMGVGKKSKNVAVERLSVIYSNCGFFGIPLAGALFGSEGVFYLTGYLTVFYLFFWTHGIILMAGSTNRKDVVKNLFSPAIIGVVLGLTCFLLKIHLPAIVVESLDTVGSMNTALAMLVAGATLGQSNVIKSLKNVRIYLISLLKLLVVPGTVALVLSFAPASAKIVLVIIVAAATPVGASNTMLAIKYNKDSAYASQLFVSSTLFAALTIPLVVAFANLLGVVP
jgi:predicted permease